MHETIAPADLGMTLAERDAVVWPIDYTALVLGRFFRMATLHRARLVPIA